MRPDNLHCYVIFVFAIFNFPGKFPGFSSGFFGTLAENSSTVVRIGHLYPPQEDPVLNLVAMQQAEQRLRKDGVISDNIVFEYLMQQVTDVSPYDGAVGTELFLLKNADLIIGPPASQTLSPLALMSVFWDRPIYAYFMDDASLSNKQVYSTLVSSFPAVTQSATALSRLLQNFNWDTIAVVYARGSTDQQQSCSKLVTNIIPLLTAQKIVISYTVQLDYDNVTDSVLGTVLANIRAYARIVVVCFDFDPSSNRQFMIAAYNRGMTNGEYVYIMLEPVRSSVNRSDPWIAKGVPDGLNVIAKEAFKSALWIAPSGQESDAIVTVDNLFKSIAQKPPYNYTVSAVDVGNFANTLRVFMYDAIYMYGLAFNRCLSVGHESYKSGELMFTCACLQTFKGLIGGDWVYTDDNGQRMTIFNVKQIDQNGSFASMAYVYLEHVCQPNDDTENFKRNAQINLPTIDASGSPLNYSIVFQVCSSAPGSYFSAPMRRPLIKGRTCYSLKQRQLDFNGPQMGAYIQGGPIFKEKVIQTRQPIWQTTSGKAPLDTPPCGFQGELCIVDKNLTITTPVVLIISVAVLVAVIAYIVKKRAQAAGALMKLSWKIKRDELVMVRGGDEGTDSLGSKSLSQKSLHSEHGSLLQYAMFHQQSVLLRRCERLRPCDLTLRDIENLKAIMDVKHENLVEFFGVCIEHRAEISFVWSCVAKRNLESIVLNNSEIELDYAFKSSIMRDIVVAVEFLHLKSNVNSHGNLSSATCLVNSRWVVQLYDFGVARFVDPMIKNGTLAPDAFYSSEYSKESDIRALGQILFEVITRSGYPSEQHDALELLYAAKKQGHFLHEKTAIGNYHAEIIDLFLQCTNSVIAQRPNISSVKSTLLKNSFASKDLVNHMISIMEKYSSNLESLVNERTSALQDERKRADQLLYQLLPKTVADMLKKGIEVKPEMYESATVYFSDIVGFTEICDQSAPIQIVEMLNRLYQEFDTLIDQHDCYKVETIGDSYLIVSGIPIRNGDYHVVAIANLALRTMQFVKTKFKISHLQNQQLQIRVGINTGPVAAGVIGTRMPKYCLFGDTVNVASRMESTGDALRIHISQSSARMLMKTDMFVIAARGEVQIKGKGACETFWLEDFSMESDTLVVPGIKK